jgi:hypothetical protein
LLTRAGATVLPPRAPVVGDDGLEPPTLSV